MRRRLWRSLEFGLYVGLLIALWAVAVDVLAINPLLVPAPLDVLQAGLQFSHLILTSVAVTLLEAVLGFALAVTVGVAVGLLITYSPLLRRFVLPTVAAIYATPSIVVAPILIIWLGIGIESKVATAFFIAFFPIVINSARGLSDVEPELLEFYRLLKASEWQIFWKVRLPSSLPALFDGMKLALPVSVIGAIIGEFVSANSGVGYQIIVAYSNFNIAFVFASVVVIVVASTAVFQVLRTVERHTLKWRVEGAM